MGPQARHEEKAWQGHVDDKSQSLWLQQQPSVFVSFSVSFFPSDGLSGPLAKKTYNIEVGHKARPYGKNAISCSCAYFARGPLHYQIRESFYGAFDDHTISCMAACCVRLCWLVCVLCSQSKRFYLQWESGSLRVRCRLSFVDDMSRWDLYDTAHRR